MRALLVCVCLIFFLRVNAQFPNWTTLGITDSAITLSGMDEFIWTATQNAGIKSFNKITGEISVYNKNTAGFITDDFRAINCFNNKVYAGSFDGGLFIYENGTWINYNSSNSLLPHNNVTSVEYNPGNNEISIGTYKGLAILKDETWVIYDSINSPLPANRINCLYIDPFYNLWIGTQLGGLAKFDGINWEIFNYDNSGLNSNLIKTITSDSEGQMYVADYFGVDLYDPLTDTWLFVYNTFTSDLTANQVNKMVFDAFGNLWFATHNGVTKADFDGSWLQFYAENSNLPHNTTDGLFIDGNNSVWVATYGGLAVFNETSSPFPPFTSELNIFPNPASSEINIVLKTNPGEIWEITLTDITGRKLDRFNTSPDIAGEYNFMSDISTLPNGAYIFIIKNNETVMSRPFIKN